MDAAGTARRSSAEPTCRLHGSARPGRTPSSSPWSTVASVPVIRTWPDACCPAMTSSAATRSLRSTIRPTGMRQTATVAMQIPPTRATSRRCRAGPASTEPRAATPAEHLARHACGRHDRRDRQQWRGHRRRRLERPLLPVRVAGRNWRHHRRTSSTASPGRRVSLCRECPRTPTRRASSTSVSAAPGPAVPPTRMSSIASAPSVRWSWRRPAMTERWSSRSRPTATASLR